MQEIKDLTAYRISLKKKIIQTAMDAFMEKGIKAVKMDDIASSLSISKRTLYELYGDKESLLFHCVRSLHEEHQQQMHVFVENHNVIEIIIEVYRRKIEEFRKVNYLFYQDIQQYPTVMRFIEDKHQDSHDIYLSFIEKGITEGYFRQDVNYELIGVMFEAVGTTVMRDELYKTFTHEELLSTLMLVPFRGFCTDRGLEVLDQLRKTI